MTHGEKLEEMSRLIALREAQSAAADAAWLRVNNASDNMSTAEWAEMVDAILEWHQQQQASNVTADLVNDLQDRIDKQLQSMHPNAPYDVSAAHLASTSAVLTALRVAKAAKKTFNWMK